MSLSVFAESLTNLRRLSSEIADVVETINNLSEQLDAVRSVPSHAQLPQRHPQWLPRITARLEASLTDEIEELQVN